MSAPPKLLTSRLSLRAITFADWDDYADLMMSERARFMGGPFSPKEAWGMFCGDHAQWHLFGCGALMVDHRESGATVGQVGINTGPLFPEFELGWFVYPAAEGKGYAFEAATALRAWGQKERGLATLVSYVDPANARSRRLAERLGATLDERAPRQDASDLVYRHFGRRT